jgi:hypothetical protein
LSARLRELRHEAVPASPDTGVDTLTGEGLRQALDGAATSTANFLEAEVMAGVHHHVALSVVGTDRMPDSGYFRAKVAQEVLIKDRRSRLRSSAPPSSTSSWAA